MAYYLIHSMEPGADGFAERDQRAAQRSGRPPPPRACGAIIYLGGLVPRRPPLAAPGQPAEVETALLDAVPDSMALRASIIIGARSRSFRFLVRLVERLRVVPLPAWRDHRTQPIDGRDVLAYLVAAAGTPARGRPAARPRRARDRHLRGDDRPHP